MMPAGMRLANNGGASFTRNGNAMHVQHRAAAARTRFRPTRSSARPCSTCGTGRIPHCSRRRSCSSARDRNRTYQAIYHVATKKLVQLTDGFDPERDALRRRHASASPRRAWRTTSSACGARAATTSTSSTRSTGTRKLIREKITGQAQLSVGGEVRRLLRRQGVVHVQHRDRQDRRPHRRRSRACTSSRRRAARRMIQSPGASPAGRRAIGRC